MSSPNPDIPMIAEASREARNDNERIEEVLRDIPGINISGDNMTQVREMIKENPQLALRLREKYENTRQDQIRHNQEEKERIERIRQDDENEARVREERESELEDRKREKEEEISRRRM